MLPALVGTVLAVTPAAAEEPDLASSCARYAPEGVPFEECLEGTAVARQATAKYRDPRVALQDGFVPDDCFAPTPEERARGLRGAVGEHWVRYDRASDQAHDPREPEVLLYMPAGPGPLDKQLVAVEWFAAATVDPGIGFGLPHYGSAPPDPARTSPRPTLLGRPFDGPMTHPQEPTVPWHYDLHVWLWEANPDGLFAWFNPRLRCPGQPAEYETPPPPAEPRPADAPRLALSVRPRTVRRGVLTRFRFRVTAIEDGDRRPASGATVRLAGNSSRTNRRGRAVITKRFHRVGRHGVMASKPDTRRATATIRVVR